MNGLQRKIIALAGEMGITRDSIKDKTIAEIKEDDLTTQVEKLLKQERISVEECSELINNFSKFCYSFDGLNSKITRVLSKVDYPVVICKLRKCKGQVLEALAPFMLEGFLREKKFDEYQAFLQENIRWGLLLHHTLIELWQKIFNSCKDNREGLTKIVTSVLQGLKRASRFEGHR